MNMYWFTPKAAAFAVALTMLLPAAEAHAQPDQTEQRNAQIVRGAFDAWATEGASVFSILSPDVEWTIAGSGPVAGTYKGVEDFLQNASLPLVQRLAGPIMPELHNLWAVDDHVIVRFDGSATTTSGAPYNNQFVWIFRMEDGVVVQAEAFLDLIAYQQVVENNQVRAE